MSTISDELVEDFLRELDGWESAYPLDIFPEPDLAKAAALLKAGGMTLDAISASNMRHVVSKIAPKARAALEAAGVEGLLEAEPFAYAYRYPSWPPEGATVIRLGTNGREINGSKPIETIPLYRRAALEQGR